MTLHANARIALRSVQAVALVGLVGYAAQATRRSVEPAPTPSSSSTCTRA